MSIPLSLANSGRRDNLTGGLIVVLVTSLIWGPARGGEKAPTVETGLTPALKSTAVEERLRRDIRYLASDELEGRGVGTRGIDEAAEYIREQFRKAGLKSGVPDGSYYQHFQMSAGCDLGKVNELAFESHPADGRSGSERAARLRDTFVPISFGGEGTFRGPVVFAGYGITAKDRNGSYDDYAGIDANGKVVMILRREPHGKPGSLFGGKGLTNHAALRSKASNAVAHGAAAVLFVSDPESAGEGDRLMP